MLLQRHIGVPQAAPLTCVGVNIYDSGIRQLVSSFRGLGGVSQPFSRQCPPNASGIWRPTRAVYADSVVLRQLQSIATNVQ